MIRLDITGRKPDIFPDLDAAMTSIFELFPKASFSLWYDSNTETWMDIFDCDTKIGRFVDLGTI